MLAMGQTVRQRTLEGKIEEEMLVGGLLIGRHQPHRNLPDSCGENNGRKSASGTKALVLTKEKKEKQDI